MRHALNSFRIAFILALLSLFLGSGQGRGERPPSFFKIAVVDGEPYWDTLKEKGVRLCPEQSEVDPSGSENPFYRGHGTNIGLTIWSHLSEESRKHACLVFLPIFVGKTDRFNSDNIYKIAAFKVNIANLSYAGPSKDKYEREALKLALDKDIPLNISAGNEGKEYGPSHCVPLPACLKYLPEFKNHKNRNNFIVVGAQNLKRSNSGSFVDVVEKACHDGLCGTSQAAAHHTGKMAEAMLSNVDNKKEEEK